jgi:glycosyltransferase involved in cell wall biosynthesis
MLFGLTQSDKKFVRRLWAKTDLGPTKIANLIIMKVEINLWDILDEDSNVDEFSKSLFSSLIQQMSEATFLFPKDDPAIDYWSDVLSTNTRGVLEGEKAEQVLRLESGFFDDELPTSVWVRNVDHKLFPAKKGWNFWKREAADELEWSLRAAHAVFISHHSLRQSILDHYDVDGANIHIIGQGLPPIDQQITPADSVTRRITKEVYGNEHSYFLAPTTGHPSDNLERLFAAYDLFRQRCKEPVRLLVEQPEFGQHPKSVKKAWKQAQQKQDIVFLPALSQVERRKVVSSARAILHPSLSTAFPLPVLDAWTAEVPVLGTDNKVMQGAGTLVQGTDEKSIAEGMVSLVTTPFLASGLVENGKRRRKDFSWEAVAQRVAAVLRSV